MNDGRFTLIGRSSSSFTRIARVVAAELGVPYAFRIVRSLGSLDSADYGGHPALKIPSLETPQGTWFGTSNVCRVFAAHARVPCRLVWPEALDRPLAANAQELTLTAMTTEVGLIMSKLGAKPDDPSGQSAHGEKMLKSLVDTLVWLDVHLERALGELPVERDLSYFEVALFCLIEHLDFRKVLPVEPYPALGAFRARFAQRPAARDTPYRFDV